MDISAIKVNIGLEQIKCGPFKTHNSTINRNIEKLPRLIVSDAFWVSWSWSLVYAIRKGIFHVGGFRSLNEFLFQKKCPIKNL